ncbi:MAG TPA: SulP family inorganic anion transporter [Gemmatimonadaceae bacterium]
MHDASDTNPPARDTDDRGGNEVESSAQADQPGLDELRAVVARHLRRRLPGVSTLRDDAVAGLSLAVANVPDGMANGVLVGINPIHGLYATMLGPVVGGIVSSTQLMVITTTAAASLTSGQALGGLSGEQRMGALFAMAVLTGIFQALLALLGFARLTRFVSFSVTTGLLTGIAVLLILSQLPTVTGYAANGSNRIAQTADLLMHPGAIEPLAVATAAVALVLALLLPRTRLGAFGRLVAIVVPSALVALFGLDAVRVVRDVGEIPRGVPQPFLPTLGDLSPDVLTGALAVAVVVLVQGVGVSQSVPNPDGARRSVRRDMFAQGAANAAAGLLRGLPVGGSMSATALGVIGGARTRWASILAGLWMAVLVIGFPGPVSYVAMPALGALLIMAGVSSIRLRAVRAVWYTGWPSRLAAATTFVSTLILPIQLAVALGVVLAALLYVNESSTDISIVQLVEHPDGRVEEREPDETLRDDTVTILDVYGHLFYAGARTLERRLPRPRAGVHHPVVVLRLRGRTALGATLLDVLDHYAEALENVGGRLYLTGIARDTASHVGRTGKLRVSGPVRIYEATTFIGESTREAIADARAWLARREEHR